VEDGLKNGLCGQGEPARRGRESLAVKATIQGSSVAWHKKATGAERSR